MTGLAGLRVALVGPLPPPAGGMANQTRQLAELLRAARAHVELVQCNAPYRPTSVGSIPVLRALFRLVPYLRRLWRAAGTSDLMHVMANSGWSWHLFAAPAIWIGRLRRVPVVVNYRGGQAADFLRRSGWLVRCTLARTSGLLVPSAFLREIFQGHGIGATVVPNVVDLRRFHPDERRPGAPLHLIVARNLEPIYDNATALRAFAIVQRRFPACRLTVAGTGPQEPQLRELARDLGIESEVSFAGRLERDDMAALLRRSTVAINPSLVDNAPNSVLEALASGVPVVSTRVGGVPYVVEDGVTALLVPPGDAPAMAAAVLRLLDDPVLAASLAEMGLVEAKRYAWDEVAPILVGAYRCAMEQRAA